MPSVNKSSHPAALPASNMNSQRYLTECTEWASKKIGRAKRAFHMAAEQMAPPSSLDVRKSFLPVLKGAVVITAAAGVAAATITPSLMALGNHAAAQADVISKLPYIGPALTQLLGNAGALGAISVAGPLLGLVLTLIDAQDRKDQRVLWALTHAALGLAMSPLLLIPMANLAGTGAAVLVAAACVVGVSAILGKDIQPGQATWRMVVVGATLVMAGAPIPAQLAIGLGVAATVTHAAFVIAAGAMFVSTYLMTSSWAALSDDSNIDLLSLPSNAGKNFRLDLAPERKPNVFLPDNARLLKTEIQDLKGRIEEGLPLKTRPMMLYGPPGTGKTVISQAIAQYINARAWSITADTIANAERPSAKLSALISQARLLSATHRVVLFVDDAETLLQSRETLGNTPKDNETRGIVLALNEQLEGIEKGGESNLVIIFGTNHPERVDRAITSRLGGRSFYMGPPDDAQMAKIIATKWLEILADSPLKDFLRFDTCEIDSDLATKLIEKVRSVESEFESMKWAGRDLRKVCELAIQALANTRSGNKRKRERSQVADFKRDFRLFLETAIDDIQQQKQAEDDGRKKRAEDIKKANEDAGVIQALQKLPQDIAAALERQMAAQKAPCADPAQ